MKKYRKGNLEITEYTIEEYRKLKKVKLLKIIIHEIQKGKI